MDEKTLVGTNHSGPSGSEASEGDQYNGLLALVERLTPGRVVLALCLLSLLAYANSLGGDFVYDDLDQVVANRDIKSWSNLERAFTTHVWAFRERTESLRVPVPPPYYRPIFTVFLTVEYQIFHLWPQGWHLVSLLLHMLCSAGVYYVLLLISRRNTVAVLAAALFAVYPIHVESVSWISAMTDPLFGVFFLWSFYFYLKYRLGAQRKHLVVSSLLFLLAAFSKETALSMVALIFAYEMIESSFKETANRPAIFTRLVSAVRCVLPFAGVLLLYLAARYLALGGLTWRTGRTYEGPWIHTIYTLPSVIWLYLSHLIWPVDLSLAYFTSFVTSVASSRFLLPVIPLVLLTSLLVFYRRRIGREVWHALAILIIPLLPVLDLRQLAPDYLVFDRYLYLSVAGWSYLIALGVVRLAFVRRDQPAAETKSGQPGIWSVISSAVLVLLLVGLTAATVRENRNWADGYSLWSQAARVRPKFWVAHYNEGLELIQARRYSEALNSLRRAAQLVSDEPPVFDALGRAYEGLGDSENAVASFKHSIELDATMFESLNSLGEMYFKAKNFPEAEKQFVAALKVKPQAVAARFNLGLCYKSRGKYPEAARQFELVIEGAPGDAEANYELGLSYEKLGRTGDAIAALERGLSQVTSQDLGDQISQALNRLRSASK